MKHGYSFLINPKIPSEEDVARYKNFPRLITQLEESSKIRKIRLIRWAVAASSVAAAIVGFLVYLGFFEPNFEQAQKNYFAALPYAEPPVPHLNPAMVTKTLVAEQGGTFENKRGSKYHISAGALVQEDGQPVSGEVTIRYREMHDYVDFFLSGIPLTYDSAGKTWQFESAGMVEILAEQDGKPLKLKPDMPIEVELVSEIPVKAGENIPKYNLYKLDKEKRNWVYESIDNIQLIDYPDFGSGEFLEGQPELKHTFADNLSRIERTAQANIAKLESAFTLPVPPMKPERANGNNFVFDLDFEKNDFNSNPDFTQEESNRLFELYKGALWQVKAGESISAKDLKQRWDDARLKPITSREFELTLIKNNIEFKVLVNPVLSGEAYQNALEKYAAEQAAYIVALDARKAQLEPKINAVLAEMDKAKSALIDGLKDQIAQYEGEAGTLYLKARVVNRFEINSFGIWNCDRPYLPETNTVAESFVDDKDNVYSSHTAYLVDKNKNTLVRFFATKGSKLPLDKNSNQMIWLLTAENQLAVFRPEDIDALHLESNRESHFVLNVVDQAIANEADIRDILHF